MTLILRERSQALGSLYFVPTIVSGLVGLFQPRKNAAEAVINRAPGGNGGVLSGNPVFGPWGAVLGPDAYIDTTIVPNGDITMIAVARKLRTGGVSLMSSLAGAPSSTPFAALTMRNTDPSRFAVNVKTSPATAEQSLGYDFPSGDTGYEFISGSISATEIRLNMPRNPAGVSNPRAVALAGTRDNVSEPLRIGAAKIATSLYPNATEIALAMVYQRVLPELEVRAIYAQAKQYFAQRSIAI